MEIFKDVVGFEDCFEISNLGNIFSKERYVLNNRTPVLKVRRQLKPVSNGKRIRKYIHRLVVEAFSGTIPDGKEVNHKDRDKTNNNILNLEVVSTKENANHWRDLKK